jgi:two-component system, chemotaxis family, protein-glutamate methylesterase/glutaminase
MPKRDIVVIGSSNGGLEPLTQVIKGFSNNLQASVFIVRHLPEGGQNYLTEILPRNTSLSVKTAVHCEAIQKNTVYIAPANYHLLINKTHTYLSGGPRENLCRPAIDPLFRSAAVAYGPRVIGIVLSGELDDGSAGLLAIKECGGIAIVQDPITAVSSSMPESAAENVSVDYSIPASDIGVLVNKLANEITPADFQCPKKHKDELSFLIGTTDGIPMIEDMGSLVGVGCPSCGGPLWQLEEKPPRYRCHVGHSFTGPSVAEGLEKSEEQALYAALRAMEERVRMLKKLEKQSQGHLYAERIREAEMNVQQLKKVISFPARLNNCP